MFISESLHGLGAFKCLKKYYCTGWRHTQTHRHRHTHTRTQPFIVKDKSQNFKFTQNERLWSVVTGRGWESSCEAAEERDDFISINFSPLIG